MLFSFADYWWFYLSFIGLVSAVLLIDLGIFHRQAHEVSFRESVIWTVIWISLALIFNVVFYIYALFKFTGNLNFEAEFGIAPEFAAKQAGLEFLTGYLIEKALAVDNIFVFAVIFQYFGIPKKYQHRVLFYGIIGAIFFRAIFIAVGSFLLAFHFLVVFFGALLILTGIKMFSGGSETIDPGSNPLIRILKKNLPLHPKLEDQNFFIKSSGKYLATPLFLVLVLVEFSDIIFAFDSVPAIFGITKEPLIVFTSNICAILGLRAMYFTLAGFMDRFKYIKYGLGCVLIFVGSKMVYLNQAFGGKFPIGWSLLIIVILIGGSIIYSVLKNKFEGGKQ